MVNYQFFDYPIWFWDPKKNKKISGGPADSNEDNLDATAIFGGVKRNIITKNFKGGTGPPYRQPLSCRLYWMKTELVLMALILWSKK